MHVGMTICLHACTLTYSIYVCMCFMYICAASRVFVSACVICAYARAQYSTFLYVSIYLLIYRHVSCARVEARSLLGCVVCILRVLICAHVLRIFDLCELIYMYVRVIISFTDACIVSRRKGGKYES